ncbi:hypothetical protein LCGC14_1406490 [marine sediment metagenome]|uniref:Uncharacterized protein n=1 Tax=marine sediment metagenome TaxID=412755 RepID=A0A0F9JVK7_9ZZZZ
MNLLTNINTKGDILVHAAREETIYMVIAANADGRTCGWAKGPNLHAVRRLAVHYYANHGSDHGCYPGEEPGYLITHKFTGEEFEECAREPLEVSVCAGCSDVFLADGPEGGLSVAPTDELGDRYGDAGRCMTCWEAVA